MEKITISLFAVLLMTTYGLSQTVGSRVSFKDVNGKGYTGAIKQVNGNQYLVSYDGYDFESWLTREQFTYNGGTITVNNTINNPSVGNKISFTAVDGKYYTGIIKQVNGGKYLVGYDGTDFESWLTRDQFDYTGGNTMTTTNNNTVTQANQVVQTGNWRIGDKVQVRTSSMDKWENATIFLVLTDRTPAMYKANLDNPGNYATTDPLVSAAQVRSRDAKPNTNFAINSRVDIYYADGTPKARGSVIEIKPNGRYKVHYDGCKANWNEEVDWSQVKPASTVSSGNADISALVGKWAMFTPSYPNTVIHNNAIYREYGTGAKSPPLQINADGTYTWYYSYGNAPVKGNWITDAKLPGVTSGIYIYNGIFIKDPSGNLNKVYLDKADHLVAEVICQGTTETGTRIR